MAGILLLYPEAKFEEEGVVPISGGVVGTVKSIFRALGFQGKNPVTPIGETELEEHPESKELAESKRGTGLYGRNKSRAKPHSRGADNK